MKDRKGVERGLREGAKAGKGRFHGKRGDEVLQAGLIPGSQNNSNQKGEK